MDALGHASKVEPRTRRELRRAHTRRQLLAAARALFVKHGYDAARPQDIARHAGVATGTFYLHFDDKREAFLAFTDGKKIVPLASAQDHKAVFDGDAGPNTGGMGAYCPSPLIQGDLYTRIEQDILIPVLHALNRERIPYRGVLYAGLMVTEQGPRVLEFNVRLGDPEAQVVLPRLRTDLVAIAQKTAEGHLEEIGSVEYTPEVALTVVLASEGYPGKPVVGRKITGLAAAAAVPGVTLYHSGTRLEDGEWYTTGGRVLGVTALAPDLESARESAYEAVGHIRFQGMHFRRDIGVRRGTR